MATYRGGELPEKEDDLKLRGHLVPGLENVEEELNLPPEAGTERTRRPGEKGYMKEQHIAGARKHGGYLFQEKPPSALLPVETVNPVRPGNLPSEGDRIPISPGGYMKSSGTPQYQQGGRVPRAPVEMPTDRSPTPVVRGNLPPIKGSGDGTTGRVLPSRPMEWYERSQPRGTSALGAYAPKPWGPYPKPPPGIPAGRGMTDAELAELHRKNPQQYGPVGEFQQGGAVEPPFDPQGSGYDYQRAREAGLSPQPVPHDDVPHWPSREPASGLLLKGRAHPTFNEGVETDRREGYGLEMQNGRYYTQPFDSCKHGSSTHVNCKTKDGR